MTVGGRSLPEVSRPGDRRGRGGSSRRWTFPDGTGEGRPAAGPRGRRAARVPRPGRAGLPDARPRGRHALGRRAAAGPARHADRVGAGRRLLRPRRADGRACTRSTPSGCWRASTGLRDLGNSVIVVEHDEATIRAADWLVDLGPGAGPDGGEVVATGPPDALVTTGPSSTAGYLRGEWSIPRVASDRLARSPGTVVVVRRDRAEPQGGRRARSRSAP